MGHRKRKLRKPDKRGRIPADVGWRLNGKGKWVQHTFYLGADENEAKRRLMRLDEFWDRIDYLHNVIQYPDELSKPDKPTWTKFTLGIALQLAAGELQIPVERGTSDPDGYATKLHALSRQYPSINFVPSDEDAYTKGADSARDHEFDEATQLWKSQIVPLGRCLTFQGRSHSHAQSCPTRSSPLQSTHWQKYSRNPSQHTPGRQAILVVHLVTKPVV